MQKKNGKARFSEVFAWSRDERVSPAEMLASGLGMAGPVLLAGALGHLPMGLAAAVGSLMVGGIKTGVSAMAKSESMASALLVATVASVAAVAAAGHGAVTEVLLVVFAGAAALIGGYSRTAAVASTRFVLFLIIAVNVAGATQQRAGLLLLIAAGALWTAALCLVFGAVARARVGSAPPVDAAPARTPAPAQRRARWSRSLRHLGGWQYTIRLTLCLTAAVLLKTLWPEHHLYWAVLTVAILVQRQVDPLPAKTLQRALGTAAGVLVAGLFYLSQPPVWGMAAVIGLLGCARPYLMARNYLAYSVIMTPLILLILDAGHVADTGVLADRLLATLAGAGLVIAANIAFRHAPSDNG